MTISRKRHFPYKHPTFGTVKNPKGERSWKSSVYYWWWAYLKRNTQYLECCEAGGKGKLSALYQDFGDVRDDDFKKWWSEGDRGAKLFAESPEESVRLIKVGELVTSEEGRLTIVFPLSLPKRFLEKRFKEMLKEEHLGERGKQLARKSELKYRITGQPNVPSLEKGLKAYDLRKANPKMPLWEIGNAVPNLLRTQKIKAGEDREVLLNKKREMTIAVNRYLKRVNQYIQKTSLGKFV